MEPIRKVSGLAIHITSPGYLWMGADDHQMRKRTNDAWLTIIVKMAVTNTLYYRLYSPDPGFGAPFTPGESWTYTEQNDSSQNAGDSIRTGTATVASATESVTVPAGTFNCYKITYSINSKTFTEYWDADGIFPYAPVKIVDNYNFASTDTKELYSFTVIP
mgnify:CR=1 FL=1